MNFGMVLSNLFNFLIVFYIGWLTLDFKKRSIFKYTIIYIFIFLIQCMSNYNGPNHFASIVTIINFILLTSYTFECSLHESLLISFFSLVFGSLAEFLSMIIMFFLFKLGPQTNISSPTYSLALLLSHLIFFVFANIFIWINKLYSPKMSQLGSWIILIVPLSTILFFMNISNYFSLVQDNKSVLICLVLLVLSNIITLLYFYKVINSVNLEKQLAEEKQLKEKTEIEYKLLSNQYNNNYTLLHTLLHSYIDLKKLLERKKYDELSLKIDDLANRTFSEFNSIYTGSYILNILISNKLEVIRKNNIHIRCSLIYTDFSFLELIDQKTFFDHILNLCISECKKNKYEMRQIFIRSNLKNSYPYLHVFLPSNSEKIDLSENNKAFYKLIKKYNIIILQDSTTHDIRMLHIKFFFNFEL